VVVGKRAWGTRVGVVGKRAWSTRVAVVSKKAGSKMGVCTTVGRMTIGVCKKAWSMRAEVEDTKAWGTTVGSTTAGIVTVGGKIGVYRKAGNSWVVAVVDKIGVVIGMVSGRPVCSSVLCGRMEVFCGSVCGVGVWKSSGRPRRLSETAPRADRLMTMMMMTEMWTALNPNLHSTQLSANSKTVPVCMYRVHQKISACFEALLYNFSNFWSSNSSKTCRIYLRIRKL